MSTKLTGYVWDGCAASGMKLSSVAIMARLADFSNDEGVCWPSIETIARQIGAGMSTVRTAIARLEAEGWLTRKARRQGIRGFLQVENMMFLKQGTFNYEKQSVVLSELSGLQRIEYLAFVQQRTAKFDAGEGELPEAERQIAFLRMGMDINAWLVSRSLWNAEQSQDVETLYASVITTWSYDALGAGAEMVLSLSGMGAIDNAGDLEHEVLTPEKS